MAEITLIQGDITTLSTDAIVNAANSSLLGGGGVDGAIHRVGGPDILAECRQIGGCPTGEAVITTAGFLPSRFVIHTVGPIWRGGSNQESVLLASCYTKSLALALGHDIKTIAFPNVSTGVYGYPKSDAARVAVDIVRDFSSKHTECPAIVFVCFDMENFEIYDRMLND